MVWAQQSFPPAEEWLRERDGNKRASAAPSATFTFATLTDSGVDMRSSVSRIRLAVDDVTDGDASDWLVGFARTVFRCGVS